MCGGEAKPCLDLARWGWNRSRRASGRKWKQLLANVDAFNNDEKASTTRGMNVGTTINEEQEA
jgi:hypothetical protein